MLACAEKQFQEKDRTLQTHVLDVVDIVGELMEHDPRAKDPEGAGVQEGENEELVIGPALCMATSIPRTRMIAQGSAERGRTHDASTAEPGAVVIHLEDTASTGRAVMGAVGLRNVALRDGYCQHLAR